MTISVEAVYEDGVLKPAHALPFKEHEQLHVTVAAVERAAGGANDLVEELYGIVKWAGTHEELQQILDEAEDDEDLA